MTDTPFARRILDAVVPTVARWIVGKMSLIEEYVSDLAARWDILKRALEGIGKGAPGGRPT
jgi:RNAse (barnase) inhibitor barstar